MGLDLDIPNKIKYYIQEKAWCEKKCTMLMLEDWFQEKHNSEYLLNS